MSRQISAAHPCRASIRCDLVTGRGNVATASHTLYTGQSGSSVFSWPCLFVFHLRSAVLTPVPTTSATRTHLHPYFLTPSINLSSSLAVHEPFLVPVSLCQRLRQSLLLRFAMALETLFQLMFVQVSSCLLTCSSNFPSSSGVQRRGARRTAGPDMLPPADGGAKRGENGNECLGNETLGSCSHIT
jgi:hypothetical protein